MTTIASRVVLILVSVITVVLAGAGFIAQRSYRDDQLNKLHQRHALLADQLAIGLASPLWSFDRTTLSRVADGALRHQAVVGIAVVLADDGSTFYERMRGPQQRLLQQRTIAFEGETIGSVKVWATPHYVEADARSAALGLVAGIVAFDLTLILCLYALLRRIVLEPLAAVERYAQAVSSDPAAAHARHVPGLSGELASLQDSLVRMIERLQESHRQLSAWHRRLEVTKDEERRLLSRELHDELGQTLTALKLRLKILPRNTAAPAASIDDALALVDGLIDRVRRISVDLRPPLLDELGLESALRAFVEAQARVSSTRFTLDATGLARRLTPELEIACFRLVQEAVTNVLRHARASHATIRVLYHDDQLAISVLDDGCGFTSAQAQARANAGHLGLVGMRERARALGGELSLTSPPVSGEPTGTRIDVRLPAPARLDG